MGHIITIDKDTTSRVELRVRQILDAQARIGAAIETLETVPEQIRFGAYQMDDQPESHEFLSYANDLERLIEGMKGRFEALLKDRKGLERGLRAYEKGGKADDHNS